MAKYEKKTQAQVFKELVRGWTTKATKEGWYGLDMETKSVPLIDPGTGRPYVLRTFEFVKNPEWKAKAITKQELFNMHWRQIQALLWGDGLVPYEDANPRIVMSKKRYRIFILCKPRLSTFVADRPQTLQELS